MEPGIPTRVGTFLLELGDRLFGHPEPAPEASRWLPRYLATAVVLAAIVAARRTDVVTNPQFYGEDGFLYFHDDVVLGARALVQPYMGFPISGSG